jgi:hypothetical protein
MRHLIPSFALAALRRGQQIEQFLGRVERDGQQGLRWIALSPCLTQFRSPSALTPISRATSVTVFPEEHTSATASRLSSSVYRLLRLLLLPTWHYFLWNLMSQTPGVHDQGEGSVTQRPTGAQ